MREDLKQLAELLTSAHRWERMEDQELKARWLEDLRTQKSRAVGQIFSEKWLKEHGVDAEDMEQCPRCAIGCLLWVDGTIRFETPLNSDFNTWIFHHSGQETVEYSNCVVPFLNSIPMNELVFERDDVRQWIDEAMTTLTYSRCTHTTISILSDLESEEGESRHMYSSDELADFIDAIL